MAHMLYSLFNEPLLTMVKLRKLALASLLVQAAYILLIRSRTMIPLQILNFMMGARYVHAWLISREDFKRKVQEQQENAKRVDEWFARPRPKREFISVAENPKPTHEVEEEKK